MASVTKTCGTDNKTNVLRLAEISPVGFVGVKSYTRSLRCYFGSALGVVLFRCSFSLLVLACCYMLLLFLIVFVCDGGAKLVVVVVVGAGGGRVVLVSRLGFAA